MELNREQFNKLDEKYKGKEMENLLGIGGLTFIKYISGPRAYMFSNQIAQFIHVLHPEYPALSTGKENAFGNFSDGKIVAKNNYEILDKIPRFRRNPDFKYLLVLHNLDTDEYDVQEICHYEKLSNIYGYMKPYTKTDKKVIGDRIKKGEVIHKSNNHDDYGNYRYGVNAKVAMLAIAETQEDPVLICKEFADNLKFTLIKEVTIPLNCNDILINLFGDDDNYRCLPEMGEDITDRGILCAIRRMITNQAIFALSWESLKNFKQSDEIFEGKGKIIDIDININKLEEFNGADDPCNHRHQLKEIYDEQLAYHRNVVKSLGKYLNPRYGLKTSALLQHVYRTSSNYINNENPDSTIEIKTRSSAGTIFEFACLTIKIAFESGLFEGCKLTDRFGTKGVIGKILPREYMPRDKFGNVADIVFNATSTVSRANPGQNIELELNYLNETIVRRLKDMSDLEEKGKLIIEFMTDCNEEQGKDISKKWRLMTKNGKAEFINSIEQTGYMLLQQPPLYGTINWERLAYLYRKYDVEISNIRWKIPYYNIQNKSNRYKTKKEWKSIENHYNYCWDFDKSTDRGKITVEKALKQLKKDKISLKEANDKPIYLFQGATPFKRVLENKEDDESMLEKLARSITIVKNKDEELTEKEFESYDTYVSVNKNDGAIVRDYRGAGPVIIANKYIMVLKQIAETGFSAVSLSSVNQMGMPIKIAKKEIGYPYPDTPVAAGYMEITNTERIVEPDLVHRWISSHSTNPELKNQLIEMLLNKNPLQLHDLPIESNKIGDDVPALSLLAYMFSVGMMPLEGEEEDPFERFDDFDMDINDYFMKKNQQGV